ncbi:MAG: thioredoxin-disulfide reductase [Clostridiales bacterium]|nr:thioredoxin-disulfide reductase [Clostridiales bacterium]
MSGAKVRDIVIIGAGVAGLSAGIYAGRAKLDTLMVEAAFPGGQAALTNEVENYPAIDNISGPELTNNMLEQAIKFGAELKTVSVTGVELSGEVKTVHTAEGDIQSRTVIIATGAKPKKLGFEGEEKFFGRGISYCATCDGFFFRDCDVFVIGGGNSAAEEALFLTRFARKVIMIVRRDELSCTKTIAEELMAEPKIEIKYSTELMRVSGETKMETAEFKNNKTGENWSYRSSDGEKFGIFVFVGYEPESALFAGQLELDERGYILADERLHTNIPGVFAAGDVRAKELRQIITASADGAAAAVEAEKYLK